MAEKTFVEIFQLHFQTIRNARMQWNLLNSMISSKNNVLEKKAVVESIWVIMWIKVVVLAVTLGQFSMFNITAFNQMKI